MIFQSFIDEELSHWKSMWLSIPREDRLENISDALKNCCAIILPNIFTLLKVFGTILFSSCSL